MSLNKEKLESELFQQYQTGIDLLEKGQINEGKEILKKLLENPAVINQDDKKILYGVYRSLAELLSLSQDVQGKCEALQYYYQSTLITENCWQTYRKMAIIFRQLGMMPRALNLMLKSLQQNKQQNLNQPIIYQICCICFLMNDKDQFIKYFMMMKDNINLKILLSELNNYFINGNKTEFVEKLLLEKSQIPHKLQQIPQNQHQQEFFNQQFDYELKIDTYDLKKFFKKIKNILQINVNVEPKKSDFINKEKCYLTNTKIVILSKQSFQKKKNVQKEQPKESQQPVKQSERQRSKKSKQQQDQQFVLDNYIHQSHSRLIDLIKNIEGSEVFSHPTGNNVKIQAESNEKQESQVAKYLLEQLNNKIFLTIIQVIEKLIILLFNQKSLNNFPEQDYKMALKGLINCIVWAQYSTNKFTDDPTIKLSLLEVAYEELNQRFKEKKPKSPDQQIKIKNYIKFINDLKLELLQIDIKQYIQDEQEIQNYLRNFYTLMAYIHSDINFFQGRIAKQCLQQLHDPELEKRVMEKIQASKIQISTNSPHQSQQINQILQQWEQKEQKLEENDKIRTQINHVLEYLNQNQSCEMIKRLATICLNQFYFVQQKEELKGIYKFVQPLIQQFLEIQQPDIQLAFIFLKFAIIQSFIEQDSSDILVKFFGPFMQTIKCDKKHIIILEILRLNHLNYQKLFASINLDVLLQQFIDARLQMKQYFQSNTDYFKVNLQGDPELNYYLISQLDLLPNHTPKYIAQQNTLQVEVDKIETKLQQPDTFSEASEEEFEFNQQFTQQYVQIGLSSDQIESQFTILGHHYQFSNKQIDFLQNHTLKINLGDPDIIDHIKRLGKEIIKIRFGLSTKELSNNLNFIFLKNYYLQPNFDKTLTQTEIQFMGYFLPHLQKDLQDSKQFSQFLLVNVKNQLIQSIEPEIQEYQDQLFNYIFSKQTKQSNNLKDLQEQIIKLQLQCDYKSNLFYLIQKEEEQQETEAQQQQQQNYRSICYALAYKDSAFLWNHLYLTIFERAENQFTNKQQSEIDWFLSQKKIQAMVNKNPQLNYLFEYRYVMDLLKAQQRQNEYQYGQNEKLFQKTQQAYQCLFQKSFNIPNNIYQIEHNFRVLQLYEKKVVRKYRILSIQNIEQNINNLLSLEKLIIQMNQNDMNYFFQSKDGEIEINQDLHINIYKFIKRFIRHRLYGQLNQLIQLILYKLPYLLEGCENQLEYEFPFDNRKFKIPNLTIEQLNAEESVKYDQQSVNLILNKILQIFQENAAKFSKKKISRYVIEGVYYSTHLKYHSNSSIEQIYAQISSIYQPNSRDLVYYYKQIHKYKIEKDEVLSRYHNHDLMFNYLRQKLVKLILKILFKENKFKEIFSLFEKLHRCFDLRLYQACTGLLDVCNMIEDKILLRDIIMKAETYRKTIEIFKQDQVLKLIEDAYVRLYEKDQEDQNNKEYIQELRQTKIEKGQKIIEEFKATKRKPPKQKETQQSQQPIQSQVQQQQEQIIQQQQEIITNNNNNNDDIGQYLNQGPILQNFNEDDNL